MSSRFTGPILALVAAVALIAAAWSSRWLVLELRTETVNADVKVGLNELRVCASTTEAAACEKAEWRDIPGTSAAGTWTWLARLTFILCVATALGLVAVAGLALAGVELRGSVPLPSIVLRASLAILPLVGGVYYFTPCALSQLEAGRGFAFALAGAILGAVGAGWRRPVED